MLAGTTSDTIGVLFALFVLLCAVALGYATGGSLDRLGTLRLRRGRLVAAAVAVQLAGGLAGGSLYPVGLALSALLIAWFLLHNRGVRGTGLLGLGLLLNALVVGLNGAMPVSAEALGQARLSTQDLLAGNDPRHELAGPDTHLRLIGDEIPVLLPVRPEVVSTGDVLIAAGLAQLIVTAMRRRPPLHPDYPALAPPDDQGGVGPEPEVGSLAGAVQRRHTMAKKGRKRRARKKSNANHGKRPNA